MVDQIKPAADISREIEHDELRPLVMLFMGTVAVGFLILMLGNGVYPALPDDVAELEASGALANQNEAEAYAGSYVSAAHGEVKANFSTRFAQLGREDDLERLLTRAGASGEDRQAIASMNLDNLQKGSDPLSVELTFSQATKPTDARQLHRLTVKRAVETLADIVRSNGRLQMVSGTGGQAQLVRFKGLVGADPMMTLQRTGLKPNDAAQYIELMKGRSKQEGDFIPATATYDLIVERGGSAGSNRQRLVYAGLFSAYAPDVKMVYTGSGGQNGWHDAASYNGPQYGLVRPVAGARMTSGYGWRMHPIFKFLKMHSGIDYAAPRGTPVYAVKAGKISYAARRGGLGNFVRVDHGDGLASGYAHLDGFATAAGHSVEQGQIIGYVGSTGLSTGPHLHFEMYRNGAKLDPRNVSASMQNADQSIVRAKLVERYQALMAIAPTR